MDVVKTRIFPIKLQMGSPSTDIQVYSLQNLMLARRWSPWFSFPHRILNDMFNRMDHQLAHFRQRSPLRSPLHQQGPPLIRSAAVGRRRAKGTLRVMEYSRKNAILIEREKTDAADIVWHGPPISVLGRTVPSIGPFWTVPHSGQRHP